MLPEVAPRRLEMAVKIQQQLARGYEKAMAMMGTFHRLEPVPTAPDGGGSPQPVVPSASSTSDADPGTLRISVPLAEEPPKPGRRIAAKARSSSRAGRKQRAL